MTESLRAKLAEVEAERDALLKAQQRHNGEMVAYCNYQREAQRRAEAAEARLAEAWQCAADEREQRKAAEARLAEVEAERDHYKYDFVMTSLENGQLQETMFASFEQCDDLRARLAEVEAFCRDYPRSAKYPDYEGGYESALDDVLEVIAAARGEGDRG